MNKRAEMDFYGDWPEYFFVIIFLLGFLISIVAKSVIIVYLVVFLGGMIIGRLYYNRRYNQRFPIFLMTVGFFIGMVLGAMIIRKAAHWGWMLALYLIGISLSTWLHKRGYIFS